LPGLIDFVSGLRVFGYALANPVTAGILASAKILFSGRCASKLARQRWCAAASAALLVLHATQAAALSETADFEKARAAYISRNYTDSETRLRTLLDPTNPRLKDAVLIAQARMYLGASEVQRGHSDEAQKTFEALLLGDPQFDPDPLTFSGAVLEIFYDTRQRLRERLSVRAEEDARRASALRAQEEATKRRDTARTARLTELASEEYLIVRSSRLIATVPFGAGQFQNRAPGLGWFFLASEVVLLAGTLVMVPLRGEADTRANAEYQSGNLRRANAFVSQAQGFTYANWALAGTFFLTMTAGVLQAHVTYVPEFREKRPRALPALGALRQDSGVPSWLRNMHAAPAAVVLPGGGQLSVQGTF
jgi:hypothetical protein